jgi:glycosyltransferase involved in cell wall biosynthesis
VYITYDGLSDTLGASQVLPYVHGLAKRGHTFELLSFEKPGNPLAFRKQLAPNVRWTALRYHKTPTVPATSFDLTQGSVTSVLQALMTGADLVHTRSYVAATLALPLVLAMRRPLLFDTRGLWPEERVDGGIWARTSKIYRAANAMERVLFTHADAVTVLTNNVQNYLRHDYAHREKLRAPIRVIPTCADLDLFSPDATPDREVLAQAGDARVLAYVGSIGTWYMAEEMARFYLAWRKVLSQQKTRLLVVSRDNPQSIAAPLNAAGVTDELIHVAAKRERVPGLIRTSDAALSFVRESLSKRASAPTKIGEYLGCGVPVAATLIGDARLVLAEPGAGVAITQLDDSSLEAAARQLVACSQAPQRVELARTAAQRWFSLDAAVDAYDSFYQDIPSYHGGDIDRRDRSWPLENQV